MKTKLLVMTSIIVAAIAMMSVKVSAFTNSELIVYLTSTQTVNGESVSLNANQKAAVTDYLTNNPVDEATAESIKADIESAKAEIAATGKTKLDQMSEATKASVVSKIKTAASKAGVTVTVDSKNNNVTITDKTGKVLSSANYNQYATTPAAGGSAASTGSSQTSGTLVYTGANAVVYIVSALAIVAVATLAVVRKRS